MSPLKILISGAGITGNALAFWLSKLGHEVTVVERFTTLRVTGLQIDLRDHGVEVLKRMGLEPAFRANSVPEQGMQVVDRSGQRRAFFPASASNVKLGISTDFEIMRGDFCRIMYDATKGRATYVFGTSIESFEETGSSVEVRFTNGTSGQFDLLIGADGQGSRTRKMMRGPDAAAAFHPLNGLFVAYFIVPRPVQDGEKYLATFYMTPGRRFVMTRRHNPHEMQAYLGCRTDSEPLKHALEGTTREQKEAMAEIFQGAGWETEELLAVMKDADNFYCEHVGLVKLDSWSSSRVTLAGDAAYCPSPLSGMGTTSGIVGAYILAGEIGRHCGRPSDKGSANRGGCSERGLAAALKAYEKKFQPVMSEIQQGVSEDPSLWERVASTGLGIALMYRLAGIASFFRLDRLAGRLPRGHGKGWDLPEYEELLRD